MARMVNTKPGRNTRWMFMPFLLAVGCLTVSSMSGFNTGSKARAESANPAQSPRRVNAGNSGEAAPPPKAEPIAWYGMMPHPYINEVGEAVKACA